MTSTHGLSSPASTSVDTMLENSLRDIGIPPRPSILDRVASEMKKDDPDFKSLIHIIGADVSLSASLIKTANSPFFGFRSRVQSVAEALMVLGLDVASRAIAGIVLRKVFPNSLNLERFWDASSRIAQLSGWLAPQVSKSRLRAEDAYTFGLFRDCGIPVLLSRFPGYDKVLALANEEGGRSFTATEELHLPTNHAMVGCLLAQSWWLPEETCLAIRYHHDVEVLDSSPLSAPASSLERIAISQFAEYLVQRHSGLSHTQEWSKLGLACLRILDLTEGEVESIFIEAIPQMEIDD